MPARYAFLEQPARLRPAAARGRPRRPHRTPDRRRRALPHVDLGARDEVLHTPVARCWSIATKTSPIFDRVFDAFWTLRRLTSQRPKLADTRDEPAADAPSRDGVGDEATATGRTRSPSLRTWSDTDALATRTSPRSRAEELALARSAIATLTLEPWRAPHAAMGSRARPRASICGARWRAACAPAARSSTLPRRRRRIQPRPIVLLCDVSGSMERYSRTLLHFAHTLARDTRRVEAFLFATRLTRITMELRAPQARRRDGRRRRARCRTGRAARASARRCATSISDGAAARCTAARSCC